MIKTLLRYQGCNILFSFLSRCRIPQLKTTDSWPGNEKCNGPFFMNPNLIVIIIDLKNRH